MVWLQSHGWQQQEGASQQHAGGAKSRKRFLVPRVHCCVLPQCLCWDLKEPCSPSVSVSGKRWEARRKNEVSVALGSLCLLPCTAVEHVTSLMGQMLKDAEHP